MMTLDGLPKIYGGTDRQKMFADSVRLNFISYIEENLPDLIEDASIVLDLRTDYRFWIDRARKIDSRNVKIMMTAAKNAVKKHGSLEAAKKVHDAAVEDKKNYFKNSAILGGILDQP